MVLIIALIDVSVVTFIGFTMLYTCNLALWNAFNLGWGCILEAAINF